MQLLFGLIASALVAYAVPLSPLPGGFINGQIDCHGTSVDPSALSQVQNAMKSWCDAGQTMNPTDRQTFSVNGVTAYACNYNKWNAGCSSADVDRLFNDIGAQCGFPAKGGSDYSSNVGLTYGYQDSNESVCDNL